MDDAVVVVNLPVETTAFVGRERELADLERLVGQFRLVTLSGPPGTGKTRLAVRVAASLADRFPDGVWFVDLASVRDAATVASKIATVIGVPDSAGSSVDEAIGGYLSGKRALMILDNFEHVLAAARVVAGLIATAMDLRVVVTSREILHLTAEHDFVVPPLGLDRGSDDRSASARLFTLRATAVRPGLVIGEHDLDAVERICRTVDGLPLAIELAAARARFLGPAAIADRIEQRLRLLSGGSRDSPVRHQNLRDAIAWSYDLLEEPEQALFRRLGVFAGTFDLDAVEAVIRPEDDLATLDLIGSLVDKSLVAAVDATDGSVRFRLLETLREFAVEQLDAAGERPSAEARFVEHFIVRAELAAPHLTRAGQKSWLDRLEIDNDNFRAAQQVAIGRGDGPTAIRFSAALWRFWQIRGHLREAATMTARALAVPGTPDAAAADGESAAGSIQYWLGNFPAAVAHYRRALAIRRLGGVASSVGLALYDLGLALAVHADAGEREAAIEVLEEAVSIFEEAGDREGHAKAAWGLGCALVSARGDPASARPLFQRSVAVFREVGDDVMLGWGLYMLGGAEQTLGEFALADAAYREALTLFSSASDVAGTQFLLDSFSKLALARGDTIRGLRLAGAAAASRRTSGEELGLAADLMVASPDGRPVDEAARRRAFEEGTRLDTSTAVAYALGESEIEDRAGLRVAALGPLDVRVGDVEVRSWGGGKAGGRQTKALFAFLFDRAGTGVTKDEVVEMVWPDADLDAGDLAFHRTMLGLRRTLADAFGGTAPTVELRNDRYRLAPGVIGWTDVARFEELIAIADGGVDDASAVTSLEDARALYRGDYLDDCPIYGDSPEVEARRRSLRARLVDVLVSLGEHHERRGDTPEATACFREARARALEGSPRADAGLARLA
jgi:predicted ATPase